MHEGNPQVEDGFTRIANELFDAVLRAPLTGVEQKVVLAVIRLTYGYNKREDTLSFSQIATATGIGRQSVVRAMVRLRKANVLTSRATGHYAPSVWAVQKRYQLWALSSTDAGTSTVSETSTEAGTSTAQDTKTSTSQGTTTSTATGTHQRQGKTVKTEKRVRRDRRDSAPVPGAVVVYREVSHLNPQKSWYDRLAEVVGESPEDLERWREVCMQWIGHGWKKTNVAGMLEYYQRGDLPSTRRTGGVNSDPPQVTLTGTDSGFAYGEIERILERQRLEQEAAT